MRLMTKWLKIAGKLALTGRFSDLGYLAWKRRYGLDLDDAEVEELNLSRDTSEGYEDSGPGLHKVFRSVEIPPGSRVLDIGSGKGGAVIAMSKFPFEEIVGVEISPELVRVAVENVSRLGLTDIRFVCCDATEFDELDGFTHIFMANPFPYKVTEIMVQNIVESLQRSPRDLVLIYKAPFHHEVLVKTGLFTKVKHMDFPGQMPCFVYSTRSTRM